MSGADGCRHQELTPGIQFPGLGVRRLQLPGWTHGLDSAARDHHRLIGDHSVGVSAVTTVAFVINIS